jgi:hypothetical protein
LAAAFLTSLLTAVGGLVFLLMKSSLTYINPNAYCFFPLAGLFVVCAVLPLIRGQQGWLMALIPLALTNAGWTALTASRGAMLIAMFCLLTLLWTLPRMSHRILAITVGCAVGVILLSQFSEEREYSRERLDKTLEAGDISARTSGRSDLAVMGWRMFLAHPLGVGTGSFGETYAELTIRSGGAFHAGHAMAAHSAWIKTLAENGLAGISALGALVFSFAYVGWQQRRANLLPTGLLVTGVLATALLSTEFQSKPLWLLAAISTAILGQRRPLPQRAGPPLANLDASVARSDQQPLGRESPPPK